MARASSVGRPRGYKPYVYRELEEFHLKHLRQFLGLLYSDLDNELRFWSDVVPLIFDTPVKDPVKELQRIFFPPGTPHLLAPGYPAWEIGDYIWFQNNLKKQFAELLQEIEKKRGLIVPKESLHLHLDQVQGLEVYCLSNLKSPEFHKPKELLQIILRNVVGHLHGLRKDALRICEVCKHYFLRLDVREARYCSPACRYRAIDQRRRGQRVKSHRKSGKR